MADTTRRFLEAAGDGSISAPIPRPHRLRPILKRFARWMVMEEIAPADVFLRATAFRPQLQGRETDPVPPVAWKTVEKTLPFMPENVGDMVRVQYLCGMRPSEIRRIRADEIDKSGAVLFWAPAKHKNSRRKKILIKAIPPAAQTILSKYWSGDFGIIFKADGKAYSQSSYPRCVNRACERARDNGVEAED